MTQSAPSPPNAGSLLTRAFNWLRTPTGDNEITAATAPHKAASGTSRTLKDFRPGHYSADAAILQSLDLHTQRARHLARNNPFVIAVKNAMRKNIVGNGIGSVANAETNDGDAFEEVNGELDRNWKRFTKRHVLHNSSDQFEDIQGRHFSEIVEVGEVLLLEIPTPGGPFPIAFQEVEAEQLDASVDRPRGNSNGFTDNEIRGGIEYDRIGRPVAYWILDEHPYGVHSVAIGNARRWPASRVIHVYRKERSNQGRGVTWLSPVVQPVRDLDRFIGHELDSAKVASMFAAIIKREHGAGSGMGPELESFGDGLSIAQLGSGIISDLGRYDSIEQVKREAPGPQVTAFSQLILLVQAMATGISYVALTGDYSQTNYSSARAAHNGDKAIFKPLQRWFYHDHTEEIRRRFTRAMVAQGRITSLSAREFIRDEERWLDIEAEYPGWEQIDPLKQSQGDALDLAMGTASRDEIIRRRGGNPTKVDRENAAAAARAEKLGLQYAPALTVANALKPQSQDAAVSGGDSDNGE